MFGFGPPNFLDGVNRIDVSGDYIYAASYNDNALSIFEIQKN